MVSSHTDRLINATADRCRASKVAAGGKHSTESASPRPPLLAAYARLWAGCPAAPRILGFGLVTARPGVHDNSSGDVGLKSVRIITKKPQNSGIYDGGLLERHAVSRPLDDELLAPRDSLSELIGMITPDDIRVPHYNERWGFDVAKIAYSVVRLRLPHLDNLTMDHRPMGWIRCEKSIKRRRRGDLRVRAFRVRGASR
jgi:hypothetical protein